MLAETKDALLLLPNIFLTGILSSVKKSLKFLEFRYQEIIAGCSIAVTSVDRYFTHSGFVDQ
jgi:hypothetical protein